MSISAACRYYGISRQAYYKQLSCAQVKLERDSVVVGLVQQRRLQQPRIGTRKLHYLLRGSFRERQIKLGRDGLFDLLREAHLLVPARRAYHKTTDSHHRFRKHPNLLKEGPHQVVATRPEEVWVADITYIAITTGFVYLAAILDAWSRRVVGYAISRSIDARLAVAALKAAVRIRKPPSG